MLEVRLDHHDIDLALGGHRWTGVFPDASDFRYSPRPGGFDARLKLLAGKSCAGVGVLDEAAARHLADFLKPKPVAFFADIIDGTLPQQQPLQVTRLLKQSRGRRIVGLLGHLTEVKNLDLFLRIATQPAQRDLFFVLAGQFEPLGVSAATRRMLDLARAGHWENVLVFSDRIASEADFNALIASTDVVFSVYRRFSRSSAILSKAARWHRPIVVADGYCMADRVRAYSLGCCVSDEREDTCVAAIRHLIENPPDRDGFDRFARDFSRDTFQNQIHAFIDRLLEVAVPS
ncbi:MAG: glycosyltransferase [Opitutaceae bacterium]|nr:glycosyltransferase [Opitutaceae bacterium]